MASAAFIVLMVWSRLAGATNPVAHGPNDWLAMLAQGGPVQPAPLPPTPASAPPTVVHQIVQNDQSPNNVVLAAAPSQKMASALPNIIFILSDDLGYGDYSISSGVDRSKGQIPTPNIQRMADAGLKFTRGYSGPVCAPSRCTLMTGRHMGRCTIRGNDGSYTPLVDADVTVAEVLQATHVTGVVGKWGLGDFGTTGYPTAQGFDHFVGQDSQLACHDWFPEYVNNNTEQFQRLNEREFLGPGCIDDPNGGQCTWANDLVRDESVAFIRQNANGEKPFFLYVSSTTPHDAILSNWQPSGPDDNYPVPHQYLAAEFIDSSWPTALQKFAAAVWAQDLIVGAVLDELAAQGIEENTIVFFSGDNGPDMHDFNTFQDMGPFRGKKRSLHEGGTRQTIAVQWKGRIAPGTESDQLFAFWDLLPTVAELAGLPRSEWPMTDGVSLAPLLTGEGSQENHDYLYWEFCFYETADGLMPQSYPPGWIQSMRFDEDGTEWKGIRVDRGSMMLWNLTADPSESIDVAESWPKVIRRMVEMMEEAHVENKHWPSVGDDGAGPRCCDACYNPQGDGCEVQCIPTQPRMSFWKSDTAKMMKKDEVTKVEASALTGVWTAPNGFKYTLEMSGHFLKVLNMDDHYACWQAGDGVFDVDADRLSATVSSNEAFEKSHQHGCTHHLSASVTTSTEAVHLDQDYAYQNVTYHIQWLTREGKAWPVWSRNIGLQTRAAKPTRLSQTAAPTLADVPAQVITVADVFAGKGDAQESLQATSALAEATLVPTQQAAIEAAVAAENSAPVGLLAAPAATPVPSQQASRNHARRLRAQPVDQATVTVEDIFAGVGLGQVQGQPELKDATASQNSREGEANLNVHEVLSAWHDFEKQSKDGSPEALAADSPSKLGAQAQLGMKLEGAGASSDQLDMKEISTGQKPSGTSTSRTQDRVLASSDQFLTRELQASMPLATQKPSEAELIVQSVFADHGDEGKEHVQAQEPASPTNEEASLSQVVTEAGDVHADDETRQTVDDVFAGLVATHKEGATHKDKKTNSSKAAMRKHTHQIQASDDRSFALPSPPQVSSASSPMKFQDMLQLALVKKQEISANF